VVVEVADDHEQRGHCHRHVEAVGWI
jgi:hypothetical protein